MQMEGHVAIVTGGAKGIGREYVEVLLTRKLKVCIADVNESQAKETISELQKSHPGCDVIFERCDVTDNEQLENLFKNTLKTLGRLDVLVNNAGILDESKEALTLAINLTATIRGTMIALGHMSKPNGGQGGVVINIGSITAFQTTPTSPIYSTTKHAVVGFTRAIGATSIPMHGVRINCICPSYVETDMLANMDERSLYGPPGILKLARQKLSDFKLLSPKTVAACLNPLLDDVTLSGAAMLCSVEHPQTVLKLPTNLADIHDMYVTK